MPTMDQPENNIVTVRICTRNNSEKSSKLFLVILSSNCHNRKHDKLHHGNSNPYPTMTLISTYCFMNNHLNSLSVNTHPQLRMEITPNFTYKSTLCDAGPTHYSQIVQGLYLVSLLVSWILYWNILALIFLKIGHHGWEDDIPVNIVGEFEYELEEVH